MDNFDLKKYLVENKNTRNSKLLKEEEENPQKAVQVAKRVANKVDDSPKFDKVVDAIAKDPKAQAELMKLMGLNEGEGITEDIVDKLALQFGKKAAQNPQKLKEEFDYGGAFWTGLAGGGVLAKYLASMGDVITPHMQQMGYSPSHIGAMLAGSIGGAILAVVGKRVYDKVKNKQTNEAEAPQDAGAAEDEKLASGIAMISKDLEGQESAFKSINNKAKMEQFLDAITSKLDPKFKESSAFKQALLSFYNKNK